MSKTKQYNEGYLDGHTDGVKSVAKKNLKEYLKLIHLSGEVDNIVIEEIKKLLESEEN